MKTLLPTASRKRLEELLTYLGDRAEDFKKCFDIESEWCWKYADLVLRGLEKRELGYSEGHHVVPASFYGKRRCSTADDGNLTVFTYGEHLWSHYCLVWCATDKIRDKMVKAFLTMYSIGICKKRPLMPSETELLDAIPEMELRRIRAMEPQWAKVEAEGRTHYCENPTQYRNDYYEANKEQIAEQHKDYRKANKEKLTEQKKDYYEANKEKLTEKNKAYREANKEKIAEQKKDYYETNKEMIAEQKKDYYKANKEMILEQRKDYCAANKEKLAEYHKDYREAHKEQIAEKDKAYREAKKAAGYRQRKNPLTGKHEWVFVGLPESPKSTKVA